MTGPCVVGRLPHDSVPHLCHIETTYACNARCLFCYNPQRERLGDLEPIGRIVERVADSQIPHVYLIGGEPSLLPEPVLNGYIDRLSPVSSVTIVTNGIKAMEGISDRLACIGVPLHGADAATHEMLNQHPGSFDRTVRTIRKYVAEGHDVRCIPVLTGYNFHQIYQIASLAADLGMESVFVDRYEDGGIGAGISQDRAMKPTREQFRSAVGQMIRAKDEIKAFRGRVGFGTAVPYCADPRLLPEGLASSCGVGTWFCAINPSGDVRLCNQSPRVYGNVLDETLEEIWNKPALDEFRILEWVDEPCRSCTWLPDCAGGCKVDANCGRAYCIDYAVRGVADPWNGQPPAAAMRSPVVNKPEGLRTFRPNRFAKLNAKHTETFLVTRYQTVKIDPAGHRLAEAILRGSARTESAFIAQFSSEVEPSELRLFVSQLEAVGAIDVCGEEPS